MFLTCNIECQQVDTKFFVYKKEPKRLARNQLEDVMKCQKKEMTAINALQAFNGNQLTESSKNTFLPLSSSRKYASNAMTKSRVYCLTCLTRRSLQEH